MPIWFGALILLGLLYLLQRLIFKRRARELLMGFMETFPGVCPICSFRAYQVMACHDVDLQDDSHDCHGLQSITIYGKKST